MKALRSFIVQSAMTTLLISGCRETRTIGAGPDLDPHYGGNASLTITGSISCRRPIPLPDDARLVVVWSVSSSSPDYGLVFGEGTIDRREKTFSLTMDRDLPAAATNIYPDGMHGFGVGYIILTTNRELRQGEIVHGERWLDGTFYGTIDNTCLIYIMGDPAGVYGDYCSSRWIPNFARGYNVGRGVDLDCRFDGFVPTRRRGLELEIHTDPDAFEFPNWM